MRKVLKFIYYYSGYITDYSFYVYSAIYVFAHLYRKSIYYNYLFILFFGLFLGYRFAVKAFYYLRKNGDAK